MATATLEQQQALIDILAQAPKQFNYDIPVYRTQLLTLNHKLTARELREWAYERGFCKDIDAIPTADDWEQWNQHYLDNLQHGDAWGQIDEWDAYWEDNTDYSNWQLDGEIDNYMDTHGE